MGYLIYRKDTTEIPAQLRKKVFKTMPAAKAALTRFNKAWARTRGKLGNEPEAPVFTMGIAEVEHFYANIERKVERVNIMSGRRYMEGVNTPRYCSPASEAYWSR